MWQRQSAKTVAAGVLSALVFISPALADGAVYWSEGQPDELVETGGSTSALSVESFEMQQMVSLREILLQALGLTAPNIRIGDSQASAIDARDRTRGKLPHMIEALESVGLGAISPDGVAAIAKLGVTRQGSLLGRSTVGAQVDPALTRGPDISRGGLSSDYAQT